MCSSYASGWQGITHLPDPPVEGLFPFLLQATRYFDLYIFSSRSHQDGGREGMVTWFLMHGPALAASHTDTWITWYDAATREPVLCLEFPAVKPPAFLTLDDRAVTFTGVWPDPAALLTFKPWHKE